MQLQTIRRHCRTALVAIAVWCPLTAPADAETKAPAVSLDLAIVADAPEVLAFRVRNVGAVDVLRGELAANTNAIWILRPDGSVNGLASIIDVLPPAGAQFRPAVIEPGKEAIWTRAVASLMRGDADDQPGVFRIYWDFGGVRSNELRLLRDKAAGDKKSTSRTTTTRPTTPPATPAAVVREFHRLVNGDGDIRQFDEMIDYPNRNLALTAEQWRLVKPTPQDEAARPVWPRLGG